MGLFTGVRFAIVRSSTLTAQLGNIIRNRGGQHLPFNDKNLTLVTHLVATSTDFSAYHEAIAGFTHVVLPRWVTTSVQKNKLANPRHHTPDESCFLINVTFSFAEDISENDKDALIGGMLAMGATYGGKLSSTTTHLLALNKDSTTVKVARTKSKTCVVVLPHWANACLAVGQRLEETPYLLDAQPEKIPTSFVLAAPSSQRQKLRVFVGRRIMLHDDLNLGDGLKQSLLRAIRQGGGEVVHELVTANVLVCRWRESKEFTDAFRAAKEVASLTWLFKLIKTNRWVEAANDLLDFPLPRNGVDGFADCEISISNYQGDARLYVEKLATAVGARFTKTMQASTTHLITSTASGEKWDAAQLWNTTCVNHRWLEESLAQNCQLPLHSFRFAVTHTVWPLGQQAVDKNIVRSSLPRFSPEPSQPGTDEVVDSEDEENVLAESDPAKEPVKHNNVEASRAESVDENLLNAETDSEDEAVIHADDVEMPPTEHVHESLEETVQRDEVSMENGSTDALHEEPLKRGRGRPRRLTVNELTLPVSPGVAQEQADPITPAIAPTGRSKRQAKNKAISQLQVMGTDMLLYEKEKKRVGGVVHGGRRASDAGDERPAKRASPDLEEIPPPKRQKYPEAGPLTLLVTGFDRLPQVKSMLRSFGLKFTDMPLAKFDVLVAPKFMRTKKFLCGLTKGPILASSDWLVAMYDQKCRLPIDDYPLANDNDNRLTITLEMAVGRARKNHREGGMFNSMQIFTTPRVALDLDTIKDIVTANGGICIQYKSKDVEINQKGYNSMPLQASENSQPESQYQSANTDLHDPDEADKENPRHAESKTAVTTPNSQYVYCISAQHDYPLWSKFEAMAASQGYQARVVNSEWLLDTACHQEILWKDSYAMGVDGE